jgi:hypothetical protein
VQDGPLRGFVFSSKEKKVKRLCLEAIALVERLNDDHMNYLLQAWCSDDENEKSDWEEHRLTITRGLRNTCTLLAVRTGWSSRRWRSTGLKTLKAGRGWRASPLDLSQSAAQWITRKLFLLLMSQKLMFLLI